jgi:alpha-L-fucosidase
VNRTFVAAVAALALALPSAAAAKPELGIFIHYGPSSLVGTTDGETWIRSVWASSYLDTVARFRANPAAVKQWVALAKAAGATYITFTAKHHDGYTLWHSDVGVDRAAGSWGQPWGVSAGDDVLAALSAACRAAGLKLYVYFSLVDWYSHSYRVADSAVFVPLMEAQLRELLTRYGPIAGVWLDGLWDRPLSFWQLDALKAEIRQLQPRARIGVNRYPPSLEANEDFEIYESTFPAARAATPQEVVFPIGRWWFYSSDDVPKTHAELRALFLRAAATGSSVLLDVPPRPDGSIDPMYVAAIVGHRWGRAVPSR